MTPTYGSLFSGVGGFDLGMDRAGWTCAWQVEIDKQCRQVLRHHWPDVPKYEDVSNVGVANLSPVDCITFGSPRQGLSVAGKRKGLADDRSGLFLEAIRILDELAPRWVLLENVPGLLSSEQGEDFAVCLEGFTGWRPAVSEGGWRNAGFATGPSRGVSWRVCDSQFFGVAQRRRRVFIVGRAGGFCPPEILLEPEGLFGDFAPSRTTGKEVAGSIGGRAGGEGGQRNDLDNHGAYPLQEVGARTGKSTDDPMYSLQAGHQHGVAHPITAGEQKGPTSDCHGGNLVADTLRVGGRDQGAGDGPDTPIVIHQNGSDIQVNADVGTVRPGMERHTSGPILAFHPKASSHQSMNPLDELCPALGATKEPAVYRKAQKAHDPQDHERWEEADYANTLNGQGDTAGVVPLEPQSLAVRGRDGTPQAELGDDGKANALLTPNGGRAGVGAGAVLAAVPRRLTPTECERLQGFPDGWTEGLADGPRYRMMGNAVTVPVIEWIGRRFP